jgi:hypothetical protein
MHAELSALSLKLGRVDAAEAQARESLRLTQRLGDRPGLVFGVGVLACVAAERGESERAGLLWSAVDSIVLGAPLGGWRRHRDECEARVGKVAGPDFERGYARGRELTLDEAVAIALESQG